MQASGSNAALPIQAMPIRVRMPYASVLLDWTVSTLLKSSPALFRGELPHTKLPRHILMHPWSQR